MFESLFTDWVRPALLACAVAAAAAMPLSAQNRNDDSSSKPVGRWQDASLEDYRNHLVALQSLTDACAKARNVKSCDPTLVGPDDRVPVSDHLSPGAPLNTAANGERRIVRYGWLRILFSHAEEPDSAQKAPGNQKRSTGDEAAQTTQPTTSQLLKDAHDRLADDLEQAKKGATPAAKHDPERAVMRRVLEGREFRNLKQLTQRDTLLERLGNWLNRFFSNMDKLRARSAWVGRALMWGFFLAVGTGLAWVLVQMERRWRVRLVPMSEGPAPDAASARDWQLWLADARKAATQGLWREAIHFVYWSAISRLESKRLWPADRARTPREYLALMAADDPRRDGLASLTGGFERTWYGGRAASETDYRRADRIAQDLIAGGSGTVPAGAHQALTAESGPR